MPRPRLCRAAPHEFFDVATPSSNGGQRFMECISFGGNVAKKTRGGCPGYSGPRSASLATCSRSASSTIFAFSPAAIRHLVVFVIVIAT